MSSGDEIGIAGRETVVRRPGADWSFHLPKGHNARWADRDETMVTVRTGTQGSTHLLAGTDTTAAPDEVVVILGELRGDFGPGAGSADRPERSGYPFPEIQDELERLRVRWLVVGLPEAEFNAYPAGAVHEDQLRLIRRRLREAFG